MSYCALAQRIAFTFFFGVALAVNFPRKGKFVACGHQRRALPVSAPAPYLPCHARAAPTRHAVSNVGHSVPNVGPGRVRGKECHRQARRKGPALPDLYRGMHYTVATLRRGGRRRARVGRSAAQGAESSGAACCFSLRPSDSRRPDHYEPRPVKRRGRRREGEGGGPF